MADDREFVYAPVHATVVRPSEDDPDVGIEDTLTPACDFCLDMRIKWEYPCADFELPEIGFGSTSGWLACDRCSELIDAGDVSGLARRSEKSWNQRIGRPDLMQVATIRAIQQGFWDHRRGSREAYG